MLVDWLEARGYQPPLRLLVPLPHDVCLQQNHNMGNAVERIESLCTAVCGIAHRSAVLRLG